MIHLINMISIISSTIAGDESVKNSAPDSLSNPNTQNASGLISEANNSKLSHGILDDKFLKNRYENFINSKKNYLLSAKKRFIETYKVMIEILNRMSLQQDYLYEELDLIEKQIEKQEKLIELNKAIQDKKAKEEHLRKRVEMQKDINKDCEEMTNFIKEIMVKKNQLMTEMYLNMKNRGKLQKIRNQLKNLDKENVTRRNAFKSMIAKKKKLLEDHICKSVDDTALEANDEEKEKLFNYLLPERNKILREIYELITKFIRIESDSEEVLKMLNQIKERLINLNSYSYDKYLNDLKAQQFQITQSKNH